MVNTSAAGLRALELARQCAMLGARLRTITHITGLTPGYIDRAVYCDRYPAPIGRPRYSEDFPGKATKRLQAEACLLAAHFRRLRAENFAPAEALIAAFQHHRATQPASALCFDQAFFLVSRLDGIWAATKSELGFVKCPNCHSDLLAAHGKARPDNCPACRNNWFSPTPRRPATALLPAVASSLPRSTRRPKVSPWQLDLDIAQVRLLRTLQSLGAGTKVRAVLAGERRAQLFRPPRGRKTITSAYIPRPLPLARWSDRMEVTHRVQFAVFASHFRRLVRLDIGLVDAMCRSFEEMRRACRAFPKPVRFDRCFEVAALVEGVWGVPARQFDLVSCPTCASHYLASKTEVRSLGCPFCKLISRHRELLPALEGGS